MVGRGSLTSHQGVGAGMPRVDVDTSCGGDLKKGSEAPKTPGLNGYPPGDVIGRVQ